MESNVGLINRIKSEMSAWVHLIVGIIGGGISMIMIARNPIAGTSMLIAFEGLVIWNYFKTKKRIMADEPPKTARKK